MRIFIRTSKTGEIQHYINTYSICSVARPRQGHDVAASGKYNDFNPLGRKTETIREKTDIEKLQISIHSVARPRQSQTHGRRKRL